MARLDILLARNLGCSRAVARAAIADGRVADAGGKPLPYARADVGGDGQPFDVAVDGVARRLYDAFHAVQHKPVGCVTALRDARYPTAYALLSAAPLAAELRPAGRLDLDTSGLLIWTTDGKWLQALTHPKRAVPRTYHAALARPFRAPPPDLTLDDGHRPALRELAPLDAAAVHPALATRDGAALFATITVVGGAYHEVRRIFAALGSHVVGLCRVQFGKLRLPNDLPAGAFAPISPEDV
jgi:16S rRNA pseudouridine516 synthase